MLVTAPPRPPRPSDPIDREELHALVEALIEEARQRQRRRRRISWTIAAAVALVAVVAFTVFEHTQSEGSSAALAAGSGLPGGSASSRLAFISAPCFHPSCPGTLHLMNPDGSGQRVVRRNVWGGVAWSPNAERIAFRRERRGRVVDNVGPPGDLYVVNADGADERKLTRSDSDAAWSPDGRKLVFARATRRITRTPSGRRISKISEIHVVNADGSGLRKLTFGRHDQLLGWLPDGRISFVRAFELYVVNADGSRRRNLTREWGLEGRVDGRFLWSPFWSPNGRKIAFTSEQAGNIEVYVMNAGGTGQRRLTRSPTNEGGIAWSPDSRRIAFVRDRNHGSRGYQSEIYVINADGSGLRRLTERGTSPRWSADGDKIAFRSSRDGKRELYVMNADGSGERRLTEVAQRGAWVHDVAWSPG